MLRSDNMRLGGTKWPLVLYEDNKYEFDPQDPLKGMLRSKEYVMVCARCLFATTRYVQIMTVVM